MSAGPEFEFVERPLIDQLVCMGWKYTTGNLDHPSATGRETFRDVILHEDLAKALSRINLDPDGNEWLDEGRITQAISALERLGTIKLLEANQTATQLLLKGTVVDGVEGWDQGRGQTVHFIDWNDPENNTFRVINQFRVDEPGGQAKRFILPDLVLFVNGIPLVVGECKSPGVPEPIEQAIDQIKRYSNQRRWVADNEGNERLFHYNQIVIATCFDEARAATFTADAVHYQEWKDTTPIPLATVAAELGKDSLSSQETLVAGMLRPAHLLDIVRHFAVFTTVAGRTIKAVCRYQQFRAVQQAVERLLSGKTKREDGEFDRRGGIVWHTQGSGKSFAMVFLIRKMRSHPDLRRFKVVAVTDRRNLENQLADTAQLSDEPVRIAQSTENLKQLLAEKGSGLVFAMIQKYQERDPAGAADREDLNADEEAIADHAGVDFPVLNDDESILVLVDEAHRSHASTLHANLLRALPNCARIGFTGTPIIMGAKKRTHDIFGDFIDRYTIQQSELDGSTVPILYEGRTVKGAVADGSDLDEVFSDMLVEYTPEELERIKARYATKGNVMEAPALIEAKARNMLRHYVENILPNGFKAQVVAVSRRAAIRYYEAFGKVRAELLEQLDGLDESLLKLTEEEIAELPRKRQTLVRAHRFAEVIRELEFAPVISGEHNDPPDWKEWTDPGKSEARIERFKRPFFHDDPQKRDPLAFLIVKSMLITGFDAPYEQVMYLDRHIKEAELLQAIARVNRTCGEQKQAGIVVDYYGVARHLKEALAAYSAADVEGALQSLKDELPKLRDRHRRVLDLFESWGVEKIYDTDVCVRLLESEKLRAEFQVKLKQFLATLDLVLPRPEGLPYIRDARQLAWIHTRARNVYRGDERPIGREVGEKVRKLIDEHVISLGIDPKIPPIGITHPDFFKKVGTERSTRTKAVEMEHALRHHIRKYLDEDPEYYGQLSERLEEILRQLEGRWEEMIDALADLIAQAREGRQTNASGVDPETEAPFLGVIRQAVVGDTDAEPEQTRRLAGFVVRLVDHVRQEIQLVGFWQNAHARETLRKWIVQELDDLGILPLDQLPALADRLVELARFNHHRLVA